MTIGEFATVVGGFGIAQIVISLVRATQRHVKMKQSRDSVTRGLTWIENMPDCSVYARDRRVLMGLRPENLQPDPDAVESCGHVHFQPAEEHRAAVWNAEVWFTTTNGAEVYVTFPCISKDHAKRIVEALVHPVYRTALVIGRSLDAIPKVQS